MLAFYGSRVSPHMTETPEGFLICHDVPIARTGRQNYLSREVGGQGEDLIPVIRTDGEVFSRAAMASFEGKPVTEDHPPVQVNSDNSAVYTKGHVQNVHRGSGESSDLLLADLFIVDGELIRSIKNGLRDVSCGYECDYEEGPDGKMYQCRIRGNHVAIVAAGRAGSRVSIQDSKPKRKRGERTMSDNKTSLVARLFAHWAQDADPCEVAEAVDSMMEEEVEQQDGIPAQSDPDEQTPIGDADIGGNAELVSLLKQLLAKLTNGTGDAMAPEDPLAQLEDALAGGADPAAMPVPPEGELPPPEDQEASLTVPAEEMQDEDVPEDDPTAMPFQSTDSAGTLAAIRAMKPYLAKLPVRERKKASDSIARAVRQARGMSTTPGADGYAALLRARSANARRRAGDSKGYNDRAYGEACAKRNPHCNQNK